MATKYLPPTCGYRIEGDRIVTDGTVRKKMSGTTLGGILGVSPFSSPFRVACDLLGLAREDISDKPAVKVGQELEPVIISYLSENRKDIGTFTPAEEVFEKREGDHDSWVSDFEDEFFAGHVDGLVNTSEGFHILEIKTSTNLKSWSDGVPEYYAKQVMLYNHFLTGKDKAYVALGMVNQQTYANPLSWYPNEGNVALFEMTIDDEEFDRDLDTVSAWYTEFILNNTTPEYNPDDPKDVEMFNHLKMLAKDVDDVRALIDEYGMTITSIAELEEENNLLYAKRDSLKEQLKEYLDVHALSELVSAKDGYTAKITTSVRKTLDKNKVKEAGLNPEDYMKETVSKTFTVSRKKDL